MINLSRRQKMLILITAILIITSWVLIPFLFKKIIPDAEAASRYSDTFNVVNALFSGLAFAGLICTILLQQTEIERQSAEINKSNKMAYLSILLNFYSQEEAKYLTSDDVLSGKARELKEKIREQIESIK